MSVGCDHQQEKGLFVLKQQWQLVNWLTSCYSIIYIRIRKYISLEKEQRIKLFLVGKDFSAFFFNDFGKTLMVVAFFYS